MHASLVGQVTVSAMAVAVLIAACSATRANRDPASLPGDAASGGGAEPDGGGGEVVDAGGDAPLVVDTDSCPSEREPNAAKLPEVQQVPDLEEVVGIVVHLREIGGAQQGSSGGEEVSAVQVLESRYLQNQQQVKCVFESFGVDGVAPMARWYEPLEYLSTGEARPIGRAFATTARWKTVQAVAEHPYVQRVSLDFGESIGRGAEPSLPDSSCRVEPESMDGKVTVSEPDQPSDRLPVVVELRQEEPVTAACADGSQLCHEVITSAWRATVDGTRTWSCVRGWLDANLEGTPLAVPYLAVESWEDVPSLPPFGQLPVLVRAFGAGLTWAEIMALGTHPKVASIWTSSGLGFDEMPEGCPPSYESSMDDAACPEANDAMDEKLSQQDTARWSAEPTAVFDVLIAVRKPYTVCPRPACPGSNNQCPERDEFDAWLQGVSDASQTCVRELVASVGGAASEESHSVGNSFPAKLTWSQIQAVAAHPDVVSIVSALGGEPPPG